jgi:hypothetical protein
MRIGKKEDKYIMKNTLLPHVIHFDSGGIPDISVAKLICNLINPTITIKIIQFTQVTIFQTVIEEALLIYQDIMPNYKKFKHYWMSKIFEI